MEPLDADGSEQILHSFPMTKRNEYACWQKRSALLTNKNFYNLKGEEIKRVIKLKHVNCVIISSLKNNLEFTVQVQDEYSYHMAFNCEEERRLFLDRIRPAVMIAKTRAMQKPVKEKCNVKVFEVDYDMKTCA
jgi:hypothetical protein